MVDSAKKICKIRICIIGKNRNFAANKNACFLLYARPALSQLIVCLSTSRTARSSFGRKMNIASTQHFITNHNLSVCSDSQCNSHSELTTFFRSEIESSSPALAGASRQALQSLMRFLEDSRMLLEDVDESTIRAWVCTMLFEGYSLKTAAYYLGKFAALHAKATARGIAHPIGGIKNIRAEIDKAIKDNIPVTDYSDAAEKIRRAMARNYAGERGRLLDILILQILEGGMDFVRIAALKKDNLEALTPEGRDIATRNCAAERRYVFALRQSERTPRQMYVYLEKRMELLLADIGLRPSMHIEDTAKNIWIRLALETGADVSAVATEAGTIPPDNPYLRFAVPTHNHNPFGIRQQVSASLLDNPMHWYALRMRPGRRMSQLLETISPGHVAARHITDTYYPCEEISKRVNRKITHEKHPFIPSVLFFRTRASEIVPLMREIGTMAYCLKDGRGGLGPYSIIPDTQMFLFQRAIRQFTPDMQPDYDSPRDYRPGQLVRIISGRLEGYIGEIIKKDKKHTARFTLNILGLRFATWTETFDDCEFEVLSNENLQPQNA